MLEMMLEFAYQYGVITVMFVWLSWTTNEHNKSREVEYQKTITKNQEVIAEQAKAFTHMSHDINDIKSMVTSIKDGNK